MRCPLWLPPILSGLVCNTGILGMKDIHRGSLFFQTCPWLTGRVTYRIRDLPFHRGISCYMVLCEVFLSLNKWSKPKSYKCLFLYFSSSHDMKGNNCWKGGGCTPAWHWLFSSCWHHSRAIAWKCWQDTSGEQECLYGPTAWGGEGGLPRCCPLFTLLCSGGLLSPLWWGPLSDCHNQTFPSP